jgi:hypothetical protein
MTLEAAGVPDHSIERIVLVRRNMSRLSGVGLGGIPLGEPKHHFTI